MTRSEGETLTISDESGVILAGRQTKTVLRELNFDPAAVEDIVLAVHELASNIVKHADRGTITLTPRICDDRYGIEINATDSGPGIVDVEQAIVDGYSTAGGLGGGLGTVHRLMDEVVIDSDHNAQAGFQVTATRWSREPSPSPHAAPPLVVGTATRPKPGCDQNGDAFLIEHKAGETLVGVIDGLGHGQAAHHASRQAKQYVRTHTDQSVADLFAGVERVCRDTRGVVMLLARFEWRAGTVTLGSVGNITLRVCDSPTARHLTPKRGVLGNRAPNPRISEWKWPPSAVMVIHSDGLTSRWQCDEFSFRDDRTITETAEDLLQQLSNGEDDATVLIISGAEQ